MQVFNTTSEERLLLTIRATDNNGTPIPVMGENEKSVIKLTDIRNGVTRYSDRDPGQCRDKNVDLPWPCRGDAWGRSKLQDAILAAQNSLSGLSPAVALQTNDISNINGGYFPPHGTHRLGDAVDMDVAGYDNLDAAVARTMVKIGQALADAANGQQITLRRILVGYEENGPFHEELQKPEHLIGGVQAALIIRRDTRGGHRDHFHAEFTVPNP
jgi:hypothetical protein